VHYQGKLFRALNPVYARDPLSGRGAERYGGRFNAKGLPALYTATSAITALREANQIGDLQPTTLVSYLADVENVFDGRDEVALGAYAMTPAGLADPSWRDQEKKLGKAPTQAFAETLIAEGHHGLLVPSFVRGARADDLNLVLWKWGPDLPAQLILIDDDDRLSRI